MLGDKNDGCSDRSSEEEEEIIRLSETVRKQYFNYLKKQLEANVLTWSSKENVHDHCKSDEMKQEQIHKCAEQLENEAIEACMVARLYQQAMIRIVANVRRLTKEQRLENHLHKLLTTENFVPSASKYTRLTSRAEVCEKATQTEIGFKNIRSVSTSTSVECDNNTILTLEQKIDIFQERLNNETLAAKRNSVRCYTTGDDNLKRQLKKHNYTDMYHKRRREQQSQPEAESHSNLITISRSPTPPLQQLTTTSTQSTDLTLEVLEEDDVAKALAVLFNEDETELDVLFGIDPNAVPDDPQISSILKEIDNAKVTLSIPLLQAKTTSITPGQPQPLKISSLYANEPTTSCHFNVLPQSNMPNQVPLQKAQTDLRNSLWPCELYMQRQCLTVSLNRLIEKDIRWHDTIKWKYQELFGDDSDDEFAICSPTIELDEVLLGSCMKRISHWLVKHLMKPLEDGLIANKYLFKKLAKGLAYSIIMKHQYPDESIIKCAVENFFCMSPAVMSTEDLSYIPRISISEDS